MPEPRWRDVDLKGNCSHCGGMHFGTGLECPYREENMGEPCQVCEERTNYCCSDCAIDGKVKVYVCTRDTCRDTHERDHAATRQIIRSLGCHGGFPTLKRMLEDLLAEANGSSHEHAMTKSALREVVADIPKN